MPIKVNCPSCGSSVCASTRFCEHCGSDLAVATMLAEQQAMLSFDIPEGTRLSPELLVPRIGDFLIEKGLLDLAQLQTALEYQTKKSQDHQPVLLGQALLELGMISRESLDEVIAAQILELQKMLGVTNLSLKQRIDERTKELRQALSQLTELNKLKSNFIANISHELRTPLTHIKGYLDLLSEDALGALTSRQKDAVFVMKKAEAQLEQLIDDLIQFSVVSRSGMNLTMHPVDPIGLIRTSLERCRNKANQSHIVLRVVHPPSLPSVCADEDKLGWVLVQLLDNALKFTPAGGEVCVECSQLDDRALKFSVKDNGIGIDEARLSEIFEPFHQLDSSATRRHAGTGLGLAMVRQIIEAHSAQIVVHSKIGHGSTFDFELSIYSAVPAEM